MTPLLEVEGLRTHFFLDEGVLRAVDGVSFRIEEGETVALVGESGCGKTIVALSLVGLAPSPARVVGGAVRLRGRDLVSAGEDELRRVRGREIGFVFQEPGAALNPVLPIGAQIGEVLRAHRGLDRQEARRESVRALGAVGIPEPEARAKAYPHELSGGMQQRAVIALATCARPALLVADEPTTALDVTVQAEILDLLESLQHRHGMAILFITHDLAVVREVADRMLVMYTGKLMETGPTEAVFQDPRHPYTRGLVASVPRIEAATDGQAGATDGQPAGRSGRQGERRGRGRRGIPGSVPDLLDLPAGCTFHPRCPWSTEGCTDAFPPLERSARGRRAACWRLEEVAADA